jgi:septum formation protein
MWKNTPSIMTIAPEKPAFTGKLVLASASPARRQLLTGAGLDFTVLAADIDEAAMREELLLTGTTPGEIASALAGAKAKEVAAQFGAEPIIIGADQILLFEGEIFEKPRDLAAARNTLKRLRGKSHELISAVVTSRAGREVWSCRDSARLTMRDFSDDFLEAYLQAEEGQLASVGAYRLEGAGAQLFSHIEGDFFTILGLPLLPLLNYLRREGLLQQ